MSDQLKEWMTAGEIADLKLAGFPKTISGIHYYAKKKAIHLDPTLCRKRAGTTGVEYHRSIVLPALGDPSHWLTAAEILDMKLPDLPVTIEGLQARFRRDGVEENSLLFRRNGQGHTFLYHRTILAPYEARRTEWYNSEEILRMHLPGFPKSRKSVAAFMKKRLKDTPKLIRPRAGSGGGYEFHIDSLPLAASVRARLIKRSTSNGPTMRKRLEHRPLGQLAEAFPAATRIIIDLSRPSGRRIVVRVPAHTQR